MHRSSAAGMWSIAVLCVGCAAGPRYFEPTEHVHGHTAHGFKEAVYELVDATGSFGEAKLWSYGAYRDKQHRTHVHVALELHDTSGVELGVSAAELRLDSLRSEIAFADLPPQTTASFSVPAGALQDIDLDFVLPDELSPSDLYAFRVRWSVHHGQWMYSQRTSFVQEQVSSGGPGYYYYGSPYAYPYDCWPYGPFDCGFGTAHFGVPPYPYPYHDEPHMDRRDDRREVVVPRH